MKFYTYIWIATILSLAPLVCAAQIPSYVPTAGLVAWYPLNGNLNDATGAGNNGVTYGSISYTTDRYGIANSCYEGNGAGEGNIPVNNFPTGNSSRSISAFFKFRLPYAGGGRAFFGWGNNIFGGRFNLFAADTIIGVEYVNGVVKKAIVPDTLWHNLTATYPTSGMGSSSVKLYLDGCLVGSNIQYPTGSFSTPSGPWHGIGGNIFYLPAYSDSWTGWLDDIGVWNRELSAAEVAALWNNYRTPGSTISGQDSVCVASSVTLAGSTPTGTWTSNDPTIAVVTGGVVTGVSAGTTIITYTPISSCSILPDTAIITVMPLPVPPIISGPSGVCAGSAITLTATGGSGTWVSSNPVVATVGASSGITGGASAGTTIISYTVTNICGSATDTQAVNVSTMPAPNITGGPTTLCPGTHITLTASIPGGTWSSSAPSIATVSSTGLVGSVAVGVSIISYTVTNACGTVSDTQLITVALAPGAGSIVGPYDVCVGATISLTNSLTGGVWSSSNSSVATVGSSTGIAGGVSTGVTVISYTLTTACGTAVDTQIVNVSPAPNAGTITGPTGTCPGTTVLLTNTIPGGTWSSGIPTIASVSGTGGVTAIATGTTIISYTVSNACGTAIDTMLFTVYPIPTSSITSVATTLCTGAVVTLTGTTPGGAWSSSNTAAATIGSASGILYAIATGSTTITYTTLPNSYGCSNETTLLLTILSHSDLAATGSITPLICYGDHSGSISVTIPSGTGTYTYAWSNGSSAANITGLAAGTYSVLVTDIGTNCTDTMQFLLAAPQTININSVVTNDRCESSVGSIKLVDIFGGIRPYSLVWSNGSTANDITNLAAGAYTITVSDANACVANFTIIVAEDSCYDIDIHDVITPNGDGINDIWVIEGINKYPNNSVQLYDKWGDRVFAAENYKNDFDGGILPDGTYFYLVKLDKNNNAESNNIYKGSFLIKR